MKNQKKKVYRRKGPLDLNDEPSNPLPSNSNSDTSKHDDSSEGEDDFENKQFGVSRKDNNKIFKINKEDYIACFVMFW